VCCRVQDADEAVAFTINVGENLKAMVADLDASAQALDLTNPEWQTSFKMGMVAAFTRRECLGAIYNIRAILVSAYCLTRNLPVDPSYERYTCGAYSLRLRRHLIGRRNGTRDPDTALKMNGFEGCQYVMGSSSGAGVHDWFGFHLSGTSTTEEPIFIDPWWIQRWDIEEVKDNYGFRMQAARTNLVVALLLSQLYLCWRFVKLCFYRTDVIVTGLTWAEVRVILMELAKRWGWEAAMALGNLSAWALQTPTDRDPQLFDDRLDYARFSETNLFDQYRGALPQKPPGPALTVVRWPT
jgi:hypothetical protein